MIRNVEMERFTLISSKPFDQVLAAINDAIGHPDMAEFWRSTHRARSVAELESTIEKAVGKAGLMLFVEFDHGAIVRKETGRDTPRMIRFVTTELWRYRVLPGCAQQSLPLGRSLPAPARRAPASPTI